jgi:hypothetical protein
MSQNQTKSKPTNAEQEIGKGLDETACSRCIVHGCVNCRHQGRFVGNLCAPCHNYITTGRVGPTTSFLGKLDALMDTLKTISVSDWKTAGELRKMARDAYSSANVKEHAPLSAGARVDHGVDVGITVEHVTRAADRGCCVSTCSPS